MARGSLPAVRLAGGLPSALFAEAGDVKLMAITNVGTHVTDVLLTFYCNEGKENYQIQQKIAPGEQMWLNFAELIHQVVSSAR